MKPLLFITGQLPDYRIAGFRELHEREGIELLLTGGRLQHGGPSGALAGDPALGAAAEARGELGFPVRRASPRQALALASRGEHRAVVVSTAGRLAPLAGWAGARRAGVPLILWASLWAHPRTVAQTLGYPALRRLYASADAVVTYGPHVSAYVSARGARNVHVAVQAVDNDFWAGPASGALPSPRWPREARTRFLFVGRNAPEKGLEVLAAAWGQAAQARADIALVLAGGGSVAAPRSLSLGSLDRERLREVYAACEVLIVPSLRTRTFREPWGLVVNEAMNRGLAVIASDQVGAAAGGLVRDGANGLVVRAGDERALAQAIERLAGSPQLRRAMGVEGEKDVRAYSAGGWAEGFGSALSTLNLSRGRW